MADDAMKPKPQMQTARPKRLANPQPDRDALKAGREFMDRHPILMARLAE